MLCSFSDINFLSCQCTVYLYSIYIKCLIFVLLHTSFSWVTLSISLSHLTSSFYQVRGYCVFPLRPVITLLMRSSPGFLHSGERDELRAHWSQFTSPCQGSNNQTREIINTVNIPFKTKRFRGGLPHGSSCLRCYRQCCVPRQVMFSVG